jgi:hypothetical protein
MNWTPDIVVLIALALYGTLEAHAIRNWAAWAYRGVVIFRRHEAGILSRLQGKRIDRLVEENFDLKEVGIGVKEVAPGLYLAQFLPEKTKWFPMQQSDTAVTGQIRLDYASGDVEFTARLTVGYAVGILFILMDFAVSIALSREIAGLLFLLLFLPAFLIGVYQMRYKRRLQHFWFLLATNLRKHS